MKLLWCLLQLIAFQQNCNATYDGLSSLSFIDTRTARSNKVHVPTNRIDLVVVHQAQPDAVGHLNDANAIIEPRQLCNACHRPLIQCLCSHLPPTKLSLDSHVLVLQHPVEFRRKTISTTPLLKLVLEHVQVLVGRSFTNSLEVALQDALREGRTPLVLFPGPNATNLEDPTAMEDLLLRRQAIRNKYHALNRKHPVTHEINAPRIPLEQTNNKFLLILVDGTWTQATRMVKYSPLLLEQCIPVQFKSTNDPSIYDSIRKQPAKHCLSTLECCCRALNLIEPREPTRIATKYLLDALKALVTTQIKQERQSLAKNPDSVRNVQKMEFKRQRQSEIETSLNISLTADHEIIKKNDFTQDLGDGLSLRTLQKSDANFVDSRWPFHSNKSLKMIERQIVADEKNATQIGIHCCWGVEYEEMLVACIIRHRNGSIGILHVDEKFRRRGLGARLLRQATESIQKRGEKPVAFILDGNSQSEGLFSALGWVKADPLAKKGTGKRKAKRKWVYKS